MSSSIVRFCFASAVTSPVLAVMKPSSTASPLTRTLPPAMMYLAAVTSPFARSVTSLSVTSEASAVLKTMSSKASAVRLATETLPVTSMLSAFRTRSWEPLTVSASSAPRTMSPPSAKMSTSFFRAVEPLTFTPFV